MNILVHEPSGKLSFTTPESFSLYCRDKAIIEAAGGIVFNPEGELLMIFRRGHWDLPKGKRDPGESLEQCALREVKEETGLTTLSLSHFFATTYHSYWIDNTHVLKPSHWYVMHHQGNEAFQPQYEEDITEIGWFSKQQLAEQSTSAFGTIQEILQRLLL
ncbi:MAG: NUDIX domain-containing protein [Bacteroidetes bacterium]|nr:NUDIX domain-containing protein [Bacteroidota bacterium]